MKFILTGLSFIRESRFFLCYIKDRLKSTRKILLVITILIIGGLLIPQEFRMPVSGATKSDYNAKSFWFYPWGKSGTHKGVDIFAKKGTDVTSATNGIILFSGDIQFGGKVVFVLGPKWRIHYYAHLSDQNVSFFDLVGVGDRIGTVGSSGNAKGKQPHLHYSITTLIPFIWLLDKSPQGWKKMFYLNPIEFIENSVGA